MNAFGLRLNGVHNMTRDQVTDIVLAAIKEACAKDATVDTEINDIMDSLERSALVIELHEAFPKAKLIENEKFFTAPVVSILIDMIYEGINASA
jgi:acyl carrier protein